ncbi:GlsB/YeaQ/YmgE family stress response membrane protein [Micromonospora sp. NPDC047527]|uniref:GlsB/YeaQ/YmgE family stress response membrane protein n=1 Tax=unclassified Micromonospora TaxID=2617518 RepID=UPI0033FD4362
MSISGLVSAVVVGVVVGPLGRRVVPGPHSVPLWVALTVGVVAALIGSTAARLAGVTAQGFGFLEVLLQICVAGVGVVLVVATTGRTAPPTPEP